MLRDDSTGEELARASDFGLMELAICAAEHGAE
jgi:hypothetical protein